MPDIDPPGNPERTYVQVADALAARIEAGEITNRLPAQRDLAIEFGVPYKTLRRSEQLLRERGLVITRQGRGTFVATDEGDPFGLLFVPPSKANLELGDEAPTQDDAYLVDEVTGLSLFEQDVPPPLVAQAFAGWELMAEAVAETNPPLASLMSSGALLARAAFEEYVPGLLDELAGILRNGGLARSASDDLLGELAQRLWEPRCPFSWQWMLVQHQEAVDEFSAELPETLRSEGSLWQMANTAIRRGLEPESAESPEPVEPPQEEAPGEWRIISTLERPSKIGQTGSLFCCRPQRGWRPHVRLEETTYQQITRTSESSKPVERNQWVVLAGENGRDFDRREPPEFAVGLQNPPGFAKALNTGEFVSSAAYFLQLDVNKHRQEMVGRFIEQHEQAIRTTAGVALNAAASLIPAGLPLVAVGALNMIPDLIIKTIQAILNRGIAATTLPSWLVQHTVMKVGRQPPTSAVLLHSEELPNDTLVGAQTINGIMQVMDDYGDFRVPQLWPRGRILHGATEPEAADADLPMVVPANLWTWVDVNRRPLVWSDSWESGRPPTHGFRVLLPFSPLSSGKTGKQPKGPHYVAALRVEVYYRSDLHV
jgi:GntR family transcriptional regulator